MFNRMSLLVVLALGLSIGLCDSNARGERIHDDSGRVMLWDSSVELPQAEAVREVEGVRFVVVKPRQPDVDGFGWQHGAAIVFHNGELIVSWGANAGRENTAGEVNLIRRSVDLGRTWGEVEMCAPGLDGLVAQSHGVFLSRGDELWQFVGRFNGFRGDMCTQALQWDPERSTWRSRGIAAAGGFWPACEPMKMDNGNWIVAGMVIGENPGRAEAAVAISRGDDLTLWDTVRLPADVPDPIWGETTVVVDGSRVTAIARYGKRAVALAAVSEDFGRTWPVMRESNLPMVTSKPYAGVLSTGQRYLIGNTTADVSRVRRPLTIAVSNPGEELFSSVYRIRDGIRPGSGETKPRALAYPYAIEHEEHLYVVYSVGEGGNQNLIEMAVIPIDTLGAR